jgi:methylated-DNA-[protein]-cysteine S-methyltransferase
MSETYTTMQSPLGELLLTAEDGVLTGLYMPAEAHEPPPGAERGDRGFATVRRQLEEYFAGRRRAFDVVLAPPGTAFQQWVWGELQRIDYGQTISYAELAARIGRVAHRLWRRARGQARAARPRAHAGVRTGFTSRAAFGGLESPAACRSRADVDAGAGGWRATGRPGAGATPDHTRAS